MAETKKRKFKLSTPKEIRVALSKMANLVANGDIPTERAKCFTYICNIILQSLKTDEYERTLEELTKIVEELEAKQNE